MREEGGFQPSAESGEESCVVLASQAEELKEDFCAALVGMAVVDAFHFLITRHDLRIAVVVHDEDLDIFAFWDRAEQTIQQIGDILMRNDDAITDCGHGVWVFVSAAKLLYFFELRKSLGIKIHIFCIFLSLKFVHVKIFLYLCSEFV